MVREMPNGVCPNIYGSGCNFQLPEGDNDFWIYGSSERNTRPVKAWLRSQGGMFLGFFLMHFSFPMPFLPKDVYILEHLFDLDLLEYIIIHTRFSPNIRSVYFLFY